ncbi:MAG: hypothetical protein JXC36_08645 [Candidatus Atribacteria bacterium]|nr:hypothetical protein [Candidatus Atribacteria bacterium]
MQKVYIIIISLLVFSCKKDKEEMYNPALGEWVIYPETLYDSSPFLETRNTIVSFDTISLLIDGDIVPEPSHQSHVTFVNSNNLFTKSHHVLALSVDSLPDGAYKMVYESCDIDFTKITSLTLSIHCEFFDSEKPIKDNDISVLIRLCSDADMFDNYFEIERPVLISQNPGSQLSEQWPDGNYINKLVADLKSLAERRDQYINDNNINENIIYLEQDNGLIQRIKGNPDLSKISSICIGIRNPGNYPSIGVNDGLNKSVKVWIY